MCRRVLLADDHDLVRQGLRALLENQGMQVVAEASDGQQASRLAQEATPDVALLDWTMPLLNGLDTAREILRSCPRTKVVLLTAHTEDGYVHEALQVGIHGYVLKSQAAPDLIQAIEEVCRGSIYLSPRVSRSVVEAYKTRSGPVLDPLTAREREVLQLVAEGKTTKEVASMLCISVKTVESHRHRLMQKLQIHETASLTRYAIRRGMIEA